MFNDYIWNPDGSLYSDYNGKKIPSRTPLSALLGGKRRPRFCFVNSWLSTGPIVGDPWPPGDQTPLSVSREFFHKVCPNPTVLQTSDINTEEVRFNDDIAASYIFEKWVEKINSIDEPCLMLDPSNTPIFEYWYAVYLTWHDLLMRRGPPNRIFGNKKRMLSIWPYLSKSPAATHWGWSPLVYDAFRRNRHLFEPTKETFLGGLFNSQEDNTSLAVPGLLAIHVRRGDFKDHCVHLGKWSSDWHAFNSFPEFDDKFDRPTDGGWGETSEANMELYIRRCYPSIEQIVDKVSQVQREAADPLRYLYIMTNGPVPWIQELKSALAQNMSWDHVGSSRDLKLTWEQKFVAQALDMYVAQRSQVFIGNGVSALCSCRSSWTESGTISGPV